MGVSSALAGAVNAVPLGTVSGFAGSSAPSGWQLCYGQAISRTQYAGLFAVVSTTYGVGDGSTTFNVPDLRGRVVAGLDNMGGTDAGILSTANTLGTTTGTETITLTTAQIPSHNHTQDSHNHTQNSHDHSISIARTVANTYLDTGNRWAGGVQGNLMSGYSGSNNDVDIDGDYIVGKTATNIATTATNQATGGGGSHNNMQPTMTINYIIKAQ